MEKYGVKEFLDEYATTSFLEVTFRRGPDIITIRIYGDNEDNFMITER